MKIIDASDLVLGRLASKVAKMLLEGETVVIVNAKSAIISGRKRSIVKRYKDFLEVGGGPRYGPFHPRRPDTILRRTIRGMLPRTKERGRKAFKRLRVYIGLPEELRDRLIETLPEARLRDPKAPYMRLGELAKEIGWKGE
jgi:large subunit ribosomal protein L13